MNLIEVLLPRPDNFYIFSKNKEKIFISEFNSITIDFAPQICIIDGQSVESVKPTVHYSIHIKNGDSEKIKSLFDQDFFGLYQTKICYIGIHSDGKDFIFKGKISAIPNRLGACKNSYMSIYSYKAKVSLSLDNVTTSELYEERNKIYDKYCKDNEISRFELMDL